MPWVWPTTPVASLGLVQRAFGVPRGLVVVLAVDLRGGHLVAEAGEELGDVGVHTDIAPTFFARVGVTAASRIASATCWGSIIGEGSFGSLSM